MSFFRRLLGRVRYGLLTQEILDRLSRLGIDFYPYVVYEESPTTPLPPRPQLAGVDCRRLTDVDMPQVAVLSGDHDAHYWRRRLEGGALAVGAFHEGALIGSIWCDFDKLRTFGAGEQALREFGPGEVALSRAWTVPAWRGRGVMRCIRPQVNATLREMGCSRIWSVCMFFNTSVRRAKVRVGAPVSELRLALGLFGGFHRDLCLRRFPRSSEAPL